MTPEERAQAIRLYTVWSRDELRTWDDVRAEIAEHIRAAVAEEREAGALWFFGVSVFETVPAPGGKEYYAGGWTHDGPYRTREECEAGRQRVEAFTTEIFKRRQVAKPCVRLTFEEYIRQTLEIGFGLERLEPGLDQRALGHEQFQAQRKIPFSGPEAPRP